MNFSAVDTIWTLLAAALVFFMQAGFAMVETGFTRAKNAGNIIMKNLMDFALGSLIFWFIGFGIMHGSDIGGLIGMPDLFAQNDYSSSIPSPVFFIFQTVFCATAATIVSGAMAERTKFSAYCIYSVIISAIVYPISGHWIWGGGWLSELGFHDFAGSTAVHMVGGVSALIGAKILGARIGKYSKSGKSRAIPGHSLTLGALGVFILWFCWFGFNGGSTVSMTGDDTIWSAGHIFTTTNLAAAAGAAVTMAVTWIRYKKPDVSMTLNGALGGLVAITAGCDVVSPAGAVIIGVLAGFVLVLAIEFIDKKLRIDDPVGAIGVHGVCGAFGTILTGFFDTENGLLYGGGFSFLGIQLLGVLAVIAWVTATMVIAFTIINKTIGLRVSTEDETLGLDITEHGLESSYADFAPIEKLSSATHVSSLPAVNMADSIPVEDRSSASGENDSFKITKISIVTRQSKFEELKSALDSIGVTGLTVMQVLGAGMQRGQSEFYRGVKVDINLLPKIRVEVVVCKVNVSDVIDVVKKTLYTGNFGDGKIFIYDVENVIKVRTGEEGYNALQDE